MAPKLITWEEINFPTEWVIPQAVPPRPVEPLQVEQIIQTERGDVAISFAPTQVRPALPRCLSSREARKNYPYHVELASSRHSISGDVPPVREEGPIQGIRISDQQIPHGIYGDPFAHHRPENQEIQEDAPGQPRPVTPEPGHQAPNVIYL